MVYKCLICFNSLNNQTSIKRYFLGSKDCICEECRLKMLTLNHVYHFENRELKILYLYDNFLEGLLFQYKECRDIALAPVFLQANIKEINDKFRGYTLVYMPSSENKTKERGFHALALMSKEITLKKVHLFIKNKSYKQSSQSFEQRENIGKVIELNTKVEMPHGKLLLFDDVGTSGATLKAALHLLRDYPYSIKILLVCGTDRFVESCDLFRFSKRK